MAMRFDPPTPSSRIGLWAVSVAALLSAQLAKAVDRLVIGATKKSPRR
ncbi:hypothetical protein ACFRFJ_15760 [Streptomyces hydrogenans]